MTLARTSELVEAAHRTGAAVPAFNVITLEHAEGIVAGAEQARCPVILQLSENTVRFHHGNPRPILLACRELAIASDVQISLHLDHLEDEDLILAVIRQSDELGVSSLMVDASKMPYDDNVKVTASFAARGRDAGLWVEAELGEIGGKDGAHAPGIRTDPQEAFEFVRATRVQGLAVAVGSAHAMTSRNADLDIGLIERLADKLTVPLVLHGSSGVQRPSLRAAVKAGIRKVNIGTALNVEFTASVRNALAAQPDATDPRIFLGAARDGVAGVVADLCRALTP